MVDLFTRILTFGASSAQNLLPEMIQRQYEIRLNKQKLVYISVGTAPKHDQSLWVPFIIDLLNLSFLFVLWHW